MSEHGWRRVVFSHECDDDGMCPVCGDEFAECDCPGPSQFGEFDYLIGADGSMYARPMRGDDDDDDDE